MQRVDAPSELDHLHQPIHVTYPSSEVANHILGTSQISYREIVTYVLERVELTSYVRKLLILPITLSLVC
jgi:L-fucose mutarotase/ribose pyranase (RbsD/FucU family)